MDVIYILGRLMVCDERSASPYIALSMWWSKSRSGCVITIERGRHVESVLWAPSATQGQVYHQCAKMCAFKTSLASRSRISVVLGVLCEHLKRPSPYNRRCAESRVWSRCPQNRWTQASPMRVRRANRMAIRGPGSRKASNASSTAGPTLRVRGRAMTIVLVCGEL